MTRRSGASSITWSPAPPLLVLDPLIRLHRAGENSAAEMAVILDGLRALARATDCAVLLVHHTRKAPAGGVPGHGLRGSSDLHAFGDTNLYLRRLGPDAALDLRIEHRAAPCVRKQTLVVLLHALLAGGRLHRAGRDGRTEVRRHRCPAVR